MKKILEYIVIHFLNDNYNNGLPILKTNIREYNTQLQTVAKKSLFYPHYSYATKSKPLLAINFKNPLQWV